MPRKVQIEVTRQFGSKSKAEVFEELIYKVLGVKCKLVEAPDVDDAECSPSRIGRRHILMKSTARRAMVSERLGCKHYPIALPKIIRKERFVWKSRKRA